MLQVLWERGFIDPRKSVRYYTKDGRKLSKDNNDIIQGTSLKEIIENLPDFKAEITLLQYCTQQLGVEVRYSPKYHPEFAGEAIEFCCALSKNTYCRYKLEEKKVKKQFVQLVDKCQEEITKQAVQTFGHQMRQYILDYLCIEKAKEDQSSGTTLEIDGELFTNVPEMSCQLVEKLVKWRKTHHNIADQEKSFIEFVQAQINEEDINKSSILKLKIGILQSHVYFFPTILLAKTNLTTTRVEF